MGKSEPSALICSRIEDSDIESLQALIGEILREGESHNAAQFSASLWDWQYRQLPSQEAYIYVIKDAGKIIGYYHVPIYYCRVSGQLEKVAMVQAVATINTARGRGVFRQLAAYAVSELEKLDIAFIYTFPNVKSIRTFLRYTDYEMVLSYDTYVLPIRSKLILDCKARLPGFNTAIGIMLDAWTRFRCPRMDDRGSISIDEEINPKAVTLFDSFSQAFPCSINRDEGYLRWRFVDKPETTHYCLTYLLDDQVKACAIFKVDTILGVSALMMLDFAFADKNQLALARIISYASENARSIAHRDIALIFTAFSNPKFLDKRRFGFLKVPARLNPRPLHLLVKNVKGFDVVNNRDNWHATLADWDVF